MALQLKFSKAARENIADIWSYTIRTFGIRQADAYHILLEQALADIAEEPSQIGSKARTELGKDFRSYRVALSSKRSGTRIKNARHVVIYVLIDADTCGISRILHESMELLRHIPEEHKGGKDAFEEEE